MKVRQLVIPIVPVAQALPSIVPARPWLLSSFTEPKWKFSDPLQGQPVSSATLSWDYDLGEYGSLTDTQHEGWLNFIRLATWWYREDPSNGCNRNSSAIAFGKELRIFARWCIEHRISAISDFSKDDLNSYKTHIATLKLTVSTVTSKLVAVKMLWLLRRRLDPCLSFDPFPPTQRISKVAKKLGIADGRTASLKPRILFIAFERALRWLPRATDLKRARNLVLRIHHNNVRLHYNERAERISEALKEELSTWDWLDQRRLSRAKSVVGLLRNLLQQAYGAMLVLLFGFVAFRKHEAAYLKTDCVCVAGAVARLRGIVRKTSATPTGQVTDRIIHPVVVDVIKFLEGITDDIRPKGLEDLLITDPVCSSQYEIDPRPMDTRYIYGLIDDFVASEGLDMPCALRPHMLRRGFCLLYAWRFEIGDLLTLKEYLYHFSIEMTMAYIEEWEVDEYMDQSEQELMIDLFERNFHGHNGLAGGVGDWLSRLAQKIATRLKVLSLNQLVTYATEAAERQSVTIVAAPHGYCFRSRLRDAHARCSTDGVGPDYANRVDSHCSMCPNFAAHEGHRAHWEAQLNVHKSVVDYPAVPRSLRDAARQGIAACERMLAKLDAARKSVFSRA
jgi:hypothetical protein